MYEEHALETISEKIAAASGRLTPTERRIAEAVLADPTLLAFGTVAHLATLVETSHPTIVRFATKLGFEGYSDLQEHVRAGFTQQLLRPSQRIRHQQPSSALAAMEGALSSVIQAVDNGQLVALAKPIRKARRVWILSGETSRAGALALHSGLAMIRPGVRLIDEHSSGGALSSSSSRDVAIVIDFARYRRHCISMAKALAKNDVPIVAITDSPLSPLAALTNTWCELTVPAVGPFDSSIQAVALAELLVAEVAASLGDKARDHIDRTEALWRATDTFI
jgi:DNA-binding MurR/RpiR family transcriptional regulator